MKHLLVIDDDAVDRELIKRTLEGEAYCIEEAVSTSQAREIMQRKTVDCIILDYLLPGGDSLIFLNELEEHGDEESFVPVIMLTGEGSEMVAVQALKNGCVDYLTKHAVTTEFLCNAINAAIDKAEKKRQQLDEKREIEHHATHDALTGLGNRRLFDERIASLLEHSKNTAQVFALIMCDLDKFKPINDEYGHLAGDDVLQTVAKRLTEHAIKGGCVFRLGGDEFALLIEEPDSSDQLKSLAESIGDAIKQPMNTDYGKLSVSTSIGIAFYPKNGHSISELMTAADKAMYAAKQSGRCVSCA